MIEFQVNDMTCGHCVGAITQAIAAVDAAAKVEVDLPTHRVRISGCDQTQKMAEAIREAGYTPVPAE
jgi:copper chaperone